VVAEALEAFTGRIEYLAHIFGHFESLNDRKKVVAEALEASTDERRIFPQ